MSLLDCIDSPADLKKLSPDQLPVLADEMRLRILDTVSEVGGHLAPNLGVVELTIALHYVYDSPEDKIVWDVGHQSYPHKLLTGRRDRFATIRQPGGLSGFTTRTESPHDPYGAGHGSTSIAAALGFARARDLRGTHEKVVAVIGDGSLTGGLALSALNQAGAAQADMLVVLNDNEWSIAKNVGAIAGYLNRLSTSQTYNKLHHDIEGFFKSFPSGVEMNRVYMKWKRETKDFFVESSLFEKFGLRYLGPVDGHDLDALVKNLEFAKHCDVPVLIHVLTKKGKGLEAAVAHPEKFHGASPFDPDSGESVRPIPGTPPNYQDVFGAALARFARANPKVLGITGAMPAGTGLSLLAKELPGQFFDVGIAEEHAVLFAAGLATKDFRPVVAIYSTFLQRAYDQIIHDVCLQKLPVTFCLDRAGLSANDGPTHHGLFDLSYLRCVPNAVVMQPKDEDELVDMLHTSLHLPGPGFIRYPRGAGTGVAVKAEPVALPVGQAEVLRVGTQIIIWALGPMVADALKLAARLEREEQLSVGVVNARFVKPLDHNLLLSQATVVPLIVTMEDHVVAGGFGSAVLESLQEAHCTTPVERIGWPDTFVEHGNSVDLLRAAHGLSPDDIARKVIARWRALPAIKPAVDVR